LAALAAAAGFLLDPEGYGSNLLADAVGIPLGILVGALLVDRQIAANRDEQWKLVAEGTRETLRSAVVRTALSLYTRLPTPRPLSADPVAMDAAGELRGGLVNLGAMLRQEAEGPHRSSPVDVSEVVREIAGSTRLIREVMLPRLLLIGAAPELVRAIVQIDRSLERLDHSAWLESRFGLPRAHAFADLSDLATDLSALVAELGGETGS
jgi:hypothetical protein